MAVMYPTSGPREFTAGSREGDIYNALKKLPDEYHVIHSVKISFYDKSDPQRLRSRECDFIVMHMEKGIMCIEAKNRNMRIDDNDWQEERNGTWVHMQQDPLRQGETFSYALLAEVKRRGFAKPEVGHALWWVRASKRDLERLRLPYGEGLILSSDDLADPTKAIERLFAINFGEQLASPKEMRRILKEYLMPEFSLVQYSSERGSEAAMLRLLESQQLVLDYLRSESQAAIHGIGGSGKTLIAVERARRLADKGEKVLFLCFNADLRDNLKSFVDDCPSIEVKTLNKLCDDYSCGDLPGREKYAGLVQKLLGHSPKHNPFPYKHIVIDEGQDFSVADPKEGAGDPELSLLGAFNALAQGNEGSLYVFYDELQMLYCAHLPAYLDKLRSRLTLFTNCRNTRQIADCALAALPPRLRQTVEEGTEGPLPTFFVDDDIDACAAYVKKRIDQYKKKGRANNEIVVLSCAATGESKYEAIFEGKNRKVRFTTVRKFKGLEAKSVILVDVNKELVWGADFALQGALFYAGASRARLDLSVVCDMDDDECREVLDILSGKQEGEAKRVAKPKAELARCLKGELVQGGRSAQ